MSASEKVPATERIQLTFASLVGAACGIIGIAGGYYSLYRLVTLIGNN